jgi:hypothetical protein
MLGRRSENDLLDETPTVPSTCAARGRVDPVLESDRLTKRA